MNIAIFGGSFDPPHLGHLAVIDAALAHLPIERLYVVPAFVSPFKSATAAPATLRLQWLKTLVHDPRVVVSDFEVAQNRSVATIETVTHFKNGADNVYVIIGSDHLEHLHKWHRFETLDEAVTWVVATRTDVAIDPRFIQLSVDVPVSSTALRRELKREWIPEAITQEVIEYYKEHKCINA